MTAPDAVRARALELAAPVDPIAPDYAASLDARTLLTTDVRQVGEAWLVFWHGTPHGCPHYFIEEALEHAVRCEHETAEAHRWQMGRAA